MRDYGERDVAGVRNVEGLENEGLENEGLENEGPEKEALEQEPLGSQTAGVVRIVIHQGHRLLVDETDRSAATRHAARANAGQATFEALSRIGAEVEFEVTRDVPGCIDAALGADVDLVVLDQSSELECEQILRSIAPRRAATGAASPPPCIRVIDASEKQLALHAFRHGAADCVLRGEDYAEVLPVVALEQIRRWRQFLDRDRKTRTIAWLERLHEAMVEEVPLGLVVLDDAGRIVEANPEFAQSFQVGDGPLEGRIVFDVLPAELVATARIARYFHDSGPPPDPSLGQVRDDRGRVRHFDVRGRRLDQRGRVLLVFSDVTENASLARRLGELEHYTDNIIENINSALLVLGADGRIRFGNPTAEQLLCVTSGGLEGRHCDEWFGRPDGRSLIAETLATGRRFKGEETMVALSDGRVLPAGVSCAPLMGEDGRPRGAVAIFQDLSEMKQLQRQVLQTEKLASIGQLAAGVAHEINNPTGFIHANLYQMSEYLEDLRGYYAAVDRLRDAVAAGDMAGAKVAQQSLDAVAERIDFEFIRDDFGKAVRESQEGSERIRHIVQDLKDFSHQDTGALMLADVNACVDSTANIVWTMMKHSVVLEKEFDDLPQLRCHPMQLKQVFMNLLVNAYQAIEEVLVAEGARERSEASGALRLEAGRRGVIRVVTRVRDGGITVMISDTGAGIAKEHLPRIFDPFFTTKEVGAGTGLGLSTSFGIVQRHGGQMTVESTPGEGTSFEVWLPLHPPDLEAPA